MLATMGYLLIIIFMVLLSLKKLSPFVGLIVVSITFAVIICIITGTPIKDIATWIREGVFYKVNPDTGKVSLGTVNTASLILFGIIYFGIMLNVGLFDPLCMTLLKMVKGDPLKICIATALIATLVSFDGDGTTTVLIVTSATLVLFRKMGMKMVYLAILIVIPNGILNFLPWGGPLPRAMSTLGIEVTEIFPVLIPCVIGGLTYAFVMAYIIGMKERKRLGYIAGSNAIITQADIDTIIEDVKNKDKELKRPKLVWVNLILTVLIMYSLIEGLANGALLFMIGTAFALMINYPKLADQTKQFKQIGSVALAPVVIIFAAGAFMGILNGTGMSNAIALNMLSWIPDSWGQHIPAMFSVIGLPGLIFLSNDAFYYGILPVIAPIAYEFGATPIDMGVASMLGQALHFGSPLVAFLYVLMDRVEISFGEYQKEYFKWGWPIFIIYFVIATATGAMPL